LIFLTKEKRHQALKPDIFNKRKKVSSLFFPNTLTLLVDNIDVDDIDVDDIGVDDIDDDID
jgi:hypothetical protein